VGIKKVIRFLSYWLPPLLWMAIIFYLSSRSRISISPTYIVNFIFFKTLHVLEYAFLYFLWFRVFNNLNKKSTSRWFFPFIIAVLFAISDELHQSIVPTRQSTIRDMFIDTGGIIIMFIYIKYYYKKLKKLL